MQVWHEDLLARLQSMPNNVVCLQLSRGHGQKDTDAVCVQVGLEVQELGVDDMTCVQCSALERLQAGLLERTLRLDDIWWESSQFLLYCRPQLLLCGE